MHVEYWEPQLTIFEKGDPGTRFYICVEGSVALYTGKRQVSECRQGSQQPWFGEHALWHPKPRPTTAVCLEPVELLVLKRFEDELMKRFIITPPSLHDCFTISTPLLPHSRFTIAL